MKENKLIAEFMGYEEQDMSFRIPKNILKIEQENDCPNSQDLDCWDVPLKSLQFHTSWDWLMPVVEKIFSLGYHYEIKPRYMMIKERMSSEVLVCEANFKGQTYNKSQKEIIYNAVVEFINQLNK